MGTLFEDISGYDTAKFLRTKYHGLPVLMLLASLMMTG